MLRLATQKRGFTLVELVIVIVIIGLLAAVAIPKFISVRKEAEQASVEAIIGSLESALSLYASKQFLGAQPLQVHNPFDDLSGKPKTYLGEQDPVTPANTPPGSWTYRPSGSWVMYHPKASISGGWLNGGKHFIIYKVEPVLEGTDTVGLYMTTTDTYKYTWN